MRRTAIAFLLLGALAACGDKPTPMETAQAKPELANPASVNCAKKGGRVVMEKSGDGGEYGVCLFEDNRQCEEWALLRGECPDGGLKVTGYVTQAARYCAIRGGDYRVTREGTQTTPEEGSCRLPDGQVCPAEAYFDGTCPKT